MTTSSPETSTRTTGARRAHREARDRAAACPPLPCEPYLDGLFTYCLSVLCDHDEAVTALADALVIAERRGRRRPGPGATGRRAWLYALARWSCLRILAGHRRARGAAHPLGRHGGDRAARPGDRPAPVPEEVRQERQRELARLAWPEAAGTSPEQREALELAVRHGLTASEVAAVLGRHPAAARELLASAACEVERTRAALVVAEAGGCPGTTALTGDRRLVLTPALRHELVRHVDDCPRCRRRAERAVPGRWPGASVTPAELPVLRAPRAALRAALARHPRPWTGGPRFDGRGFPMNPGHRAARRARLRTRALTTAVLATVVTAPALALWAAHRPDPAGQDQGGPSATARESPGSGVLTGDGAEGHRKAGRGTGSGAGHAVADSGPGADDEVSVRVSGAAEAGRGDGRLTVTATGSGDATLVTLTASGPDPVHWSVTTGAAWLYPNRSWGTLQPGASVTVRIHVDPLREPSGRWRAQVTVGPVGAVITISGHGPVPGPSAPTHRVTPPAGTRPHPSVSPLPTHTRADPPGGGAPGDGTTPPPDPTPPSGSGTSGPPGDDGAGPGATAGP
ncbi:hypothetical protein [Streptomyces thermodiastaticus]|uniref:hypothetical protein n=1 Tax=Streptomyces thermodiastaticus TaxID=44061 RepID=UPI00167C2476|nr:hypothetical protein [Streptomyces thermodiastaticus]MCE7551837.1 hypothetical protein [Streptomyces thermodiastaticus]GHF76102.1 hypothetical protein GCM10018787_25940 [Streptomyces thermodiastaticus]